MYYVDVCYEQSVYSTSYTIFFSDMQRFLHLLHLNGVCGCPNPVYPDCLFWTCLCSHENTKVETCTTKYIVTDCVALLQASLDM